VTTLADVAAINKALKRASFAREGSVSSAANRKALWDHFICYVHREILDHGQAALVARPAAEGAQLYVEGAEGRLRGAFRDPLGIARSMAELGLGRIELSGDRAASRLAVVLAALFDGPFEPVADTGVFACGDRFVEQLEEGGLPALPGVTWEPLEHKPRRASTVPNVEGFAASIRARTAVQVVKLLQRGVSPQVEAMDLSLYCRQVMARARVFNEGQDDVASATLLWSWCAQALPAERDHSRVIAIMRSVARKRSEGVGGPQDMEGAVHIWQAVYRVARSADDRLRMIKSMMKVANLRTDLSGPWEAVDISAAVRIWQGVWQLHHSPDDDARVVRTMMDVANRLTDLRSAQPLRVGAALTIWQGITVLELPREDEGRTLATMMDLARRLSDGGGAAVDLDGALKLWGTVYQLEHSPDGRLGVIKHMMAAANRRSQAGLPEGERDLEGAIAIWRAIHELEEDDGERERVVLTMMSVARAMVDTGELGAAFTLWDAASRTRGDERFLLRTIKIVMALASSSPVFASQAAGLLAGGLPRRLAPGFREPVLAGLHYYANDFDAVLRMAQTSEAVAVRALAADAQRKLGLILQAMEAASSVIGGSRHDDGPVQADARVSALCCRAYCYLEQGRAGADVLERAVADLEEAVEVAQSAALTVPPRLYTGLGYVHRARGKDDQAEAAFAEALRLDADNRKALHASEADELDAPSSDVLDAEPTGHVTLDIFERAVRRSGRAEVVVELLRAQAGPDVAAAALEPYIRAVMARARQLNERDDDVQGAIALWSVCAEVLKEPEDHERVIAIMRAVARKRAEGVGGARDIAGAVRILQAVHRASREPDQRLRVVKSMMKVANLHTDIGGPWSAVDVEVALRFWRGAWELHHSSGDDERVIRTMMSVAAKLAGPGEPLADTIDAANAIWSAVADMEGTTERVVEAREASGR